MTSTVLSEVIAFTAFIVLLSISLVYFTLHQAAIAISTDKAILRDVAEYTATSLTNLISLTNSSKESSMFLMKILSIPQDVNGKGYFITLKNNTGIWMVVVYYSESMKEEAKLWNSRSINVLSEDDNLTQYGVKLLSEIPSGLMKPVVWCWKKNGTIFVGLGKVSE